MVAEVIQVSDLALSIGRVVEERCLQKRRGQRQQISSRSGACDLTGAAPRLTTTTYGGGIVEGAQFKMRSTLRTLVVLVLAVGLLALFLYHVDLRRVGSSIVHAEPEWLMLSFATTLANLAIRAYRWQYLLDPLGKVRFGSAFRATAVGFAASTVLPARAGEVIRPYFLARHEHMSATGAFATIILERLLDVVAVLVLLASYVFVFGRGLN